ncbi:hypothetical protein GCM10010978_13760 [Compostibacillus humi]|uniref:Uncharacterized protein n=2 Tax=Compostibacillus humi TaxID=1245525 RepID=A0A8J3EK85_9BACI|nr:hypothetical protein GCM10010978_13760 [Compostibacillus humi]
MDYRLGNVEGKNKLHAKFCGIIYFTRFFANSIDGTNVLDFIQQPIIAFSDYPLIIFFFIQLVFIFMSLFGVHPIATIGVLTGVVNLLLETFNPVSLAIVIVTGAISTLPVGSYGLVVQLTSMNTGQIHIGLHG